MLSRLPLFWGGLEMGWVILLGLVALCVYGIVWGSKHKAEAAKIETEVKDEVKKL